MKFNIFTLVFYEFEISLSLLKIILCLLIEIEIAENRATEKYSAPRLIEKHTVESMIDA